MYARLDLVAGSGGGGGMTRAPVHFACPCEESPWYAGARRRRSPREGVARALRGTWRTRRFALRGMDRPARLGRATDAA